MAASALGAGRSFRRLSFDEGDPGDGDGGGDGGGAPDGGSDTGTDPGGTLPGGDTPGAGLPDDGSTVRDPADTGSAGGAFGRTDESGSPEIRFEDGIPVLTSRFDARGTDDPTRSDSNAPSFPDVWRLPDDDVGGPSSADPASNHDPQAHPPSTGQPPTTTPNTIDTHRLAGGSSFGVEAGFAWVIGAAAGVQVAADLGPGSGSVGVSGFAAPFGMGGFVSWGSSALVSWTWQESGTPTNAAPPVSFGCGRSVLVVVPFLMLQLTESSWGDPSAVEASLSGSLTTLGLGVFGGVQCGGTWRPPAALH